MRVLTGVIISAAVALCGIAQADVYRWLDNQGGIHYTESPPPAGNRDRGTRIHTYGAPSGGQEQGHQRAQAIQNQLKEIATQREKANSERNKQETEKTRRTTNCQAARDNLAKLQIRTNRRLIDKEGNVTTLTEEERLKRMETARKQIEENCN